MPIYNHVPFATTSDKSAHRAELGSEPVRLATVLSVSDARFETFYTSEDEAKLPGWVVCKSKRGKGFTFRWFRLAQDSADLAEIRSQIWERLSATARTDRCIDTATAYVARLADLSTVREESVSAGKRQQVANPCESNPVTLKPLQALFNGVSMAAQFGAGPDRLAHMVLFGITNGKGDQTHEGFDTLCDRFDAATEEGATAINAELTDLGLPLAYDASVHAISLVTPDAEESDDSEAAAE